MDGQSIIVVVGIIAATGGIFLSVLTSFISSYLEQNRKSKLFPPLRINRPNKDTIVGSTAGVDLIESEITYETLDYLLNKRFDEVRENIRQYQRQAILNDLGSGFLIFGQSIIGGVLATSFVQETLSKQIVGGLGVLVLLATLIHQSYRPDVKARVAKAKSSYLRRILRKAENDKIRDGEKTFTEVVNQLTAGLNKVDNDEEWSENNFMGQNKQS